jgi:hypothetical protein
MMNAFTTDARNTLEERKTNSVTHQVVKNGKVIHQHEKHIGKYGVLRCGRTESVSHQTHPVL